MQSANFFEYEFRVEIHGDLVQNDDLWDLPDKFQTGPVTEELAGKLLVTKDARKHPQVVLRWVAILLEVCICCNVLLKGRAPTVVS